MKKMAAGVFKANCLAVMDDVQAKRETVVITKHGKPVTKLVPINSGANSIDSCRHTCGRLARLRPKPDFQEGKSHH